MELNAEKIEQINAETARAREMIDAVIVGSLPHCRICDSVENCQFAASLGQEGLIRCARAPEPSGRIYCCGTLSYRSTS